ncbi:hypothetical protein L195_g063253, partial [Trifolium pratense]
CDEVLTPNEGDEPNGCDEELTPNGCDCGFVGALELNGEDVDAPNGCDEELVPNEGDEPNGCDEEFPPNRDWVWQKIDDVAADVE